MNPIKKIIKSIKSDFETLNNILQGKAKLQTDEKFTPKLYFQALKEYSWVFWLLALAFVVGVFFSSQYYQQQCNDYINENYIPKIEECYMAGELSQVPVFDSPLLFNNQQNATHDDSSTLE